MYVALTQQNSVRNVVSGTCVYSKYSNFAGSTIAVSAYGVKCPLPPMAVDKPLVILQIHNMHILEYHA